MQFVLIPLDNRPITYLFPQIVCRVAGVTAFAPPRELMGSLVAPSRPGGLAEWLGETLKGRSPDKLLVCLDSLVYGGLINSRRSEETETEVFNRIKEIPVWKKISIRPISVLAQSSIMRIADNYDNMEEKKYWARYGREIYQWSELLHKNTAGIKLPAGALALAESRIEPPVRDDYLKTRRRNFKANMKLLEYVRSGEIDFLVFSQDDCGEFGLNILEREKLTNSALTQGVARKVMSYAGSDETLLTLIARALIDSAQKRPTVLIHYSSPYGSRIQSRYEGQTIGDSVENQTHAAGLLTVNDPESPHDLVLLVHTADHQQGDHVQLQGHPDLRQVSSNDALRTTLDALEKSEKPVILCDVAYANGGDPALIAELLKRGHLLQKLCAYAGWNTTGNTVGSAIALGVARWYATSFGSTAGSDRAFQEAMFIRFADDWAYQTRVRPQLNGVSVGDSKLAELMKPFITEIGAASGWQVPAVRVSLPWQRTFEVEVAIPS
ncbi:MAG: DUF4127 family protein [Candidatus Obscuribacterales bacterium]|nr:DUF4127 family protein [Candidatus Obscuribacterales bacterium]